MLTALRFLPQASTGHNHGLWSGGLHSTAIVADICVRHTGISMSEQWPSHDATLLDTRCTSAARMKPQMLTDGVLGTIDAQL